MEEYIELIKARAINPDDDIWKININGGIAVYRNFKDSNGNYLNSCEYMTQFNHETVYSILKTLSDPEAFYKSYLERPSNEVSGFARFNKKQFTKLKPKPKKFGTVEGTQYYVDDLGNFYEYTPMGTAKVELAQWERFHDNKDAVLAHIFNCGLHNEQTLKWFDNMEQFKAWVKELYDNQPTWAAMPHCEIVRIGYKAKHPDERENYIRIPWYPVDRMLKEGCSFNQIVEGWKEELRGIEFFVEVFTRCGWNIIMEQVLNKYVAYKKKQEEKDRNGNV